MGLWGPSVGAHVGHFLQRARGVTAVPFPLRHGPWQWSFRGCQVPDQPEQAVDPLISLGTLRCSDHAWLFCLGFLGRIGWAELRHSQHMKI